MLILTATNAIIFLILGIPLVALSVHSFKERNVLIEKIDKQQNLLNEKIDKQQNLLDEKIDKEGNELNEKIDLLIEDLNDQNKTIIKNAKEIKVLESFKTFYGFERVGKYGYFQKLDEKMTYGDGQKACSKIFGQIIEFNETSNDYFSSEQSDDVL